jgi:hypothetical protein
MSAPLINSRTPAVDATNVYLNQLIYVVFDQVIDSTTLTDNTVVLYRISDYQVIEKKITWDAATLKMTVTPDIAFDQNTQYNVVVVGLDSSATCVKNVSGEGLATTATWYFTTGTSVYIPATDTIPETPAEQEVASAPAYEVLTPRSTTDFAIVSTSPENYSANLGSINSDYATVYYAGPVMVTFNELVASGSAVSQDWLSFVAEASDGDPSTTTALPSGTITNVTGKTLTWTPSTYNGNDYAWRTNNEITVTVSENVKNYLGTALGVSYKFMFTTAYRPYYCTIPRIKSVIGSFIREIPDETIARNIYLNSLEIYNIANTIYSQYLWDIDNPTFAAKMWVCCKTQYDILYAKLLDMASVGPGQIKRLGDFTIQESTDIQAGVKGALQKSLDCTNAWLKLVLGKYRRAKSKMVVKGVTSPAIPPIRGVRTWTLETGRDTLGANKTLTRRIKSPGIYSDWS